MRQKRLTDHDEPEPTEEELRAAAELARALDGKGDPAPGSDAAFASALRASRRGAPKLAPEVRAAVVDRAVARGGGRRRTRTATRWLAIAAAALLAVGIPVGIALTNGTATVVTVPVSYGGRTDALLGSAIDDERTSGARMDVIAHARTRDYFAAWAAVEEGAR
jgi:hypothetical protein